MEKLEELMQNLKPIKYGWVGNDGKPHNGIGHEFSKHYRLQIKDEILKSGHGVCWDQCEYEAYFLTKNKIPCQTYFIFYNDHKNLPSHTFLVTKIGKKYIWFEHSWAKFAGIHEYNSEAKLLADVKQKFVEDSYFKDDYDENELYINDYERPTKKLTCDEFYKHCA